MSRQVSVTCYFGSNGQSHEVRPSDDFVRSKLRIKLMARLRHIANLWTLWDHPSADIEWPLETKLRSIADAGFDGVCWAPSAELHAWCDRLGLIFLGGMASSDPAGFPTNLDDLRRFGARHVNVQLGQDDTPAPVALELTVSLLSQAHVMSLLPAIETHRGTCTETPEKMYALADAYEEITGELLPISFDFSHFAVVKHLVPENFTARLLVRPDLVQRACQFHFRPFNGHHVQVPITDRAGRITREVEDWLPFGEAVLRCWLQANAAGDRELFLCPELGPVRGGYALSSFPKSWEDAKVLRELIAALWARIIPDFGLTATASADTPWESRP